MTGEQWAKVRSLLESALAVSGEERTLLLDTACAGDANLRAEVEALLAAENDADALFSVDRWLSESQDEELISPPEKLMGRYRIVREIGRGGMGTVYLAERADGEYQHQVALKLMHDSLLGAATVERFRRERQILASLSHPGIARLLDGGVTAEGRPFAVMEYVAGEAIDLYCERMRLSVEEILHLFLRVAQAVQFAHQNLVLHLDIKPANILVTAEGEPRLVDFGVSRILSESGSISVHPTMQLLTPRYASPEQAGNEAVSVASDEFSLATLLYKLLTGTLPYPVEDVMPWEAARIIRETPAVPPSEAAPAERKASLRGDLDTILLQALRKEPARRYPTVAEFAQDVERYLASKPVRAHKDSFSYRAGKFAQRHRGGLIVAAIVLVIVAASVTMVVHSAIVARRQERLAERRFQDAEQLARGYIFDLDPKLENIPGTIGVRAFVLQNALGYLDAMSSEKGDDDTLARELGRGYMRVAKVQSSVGLPSLSDKAGAWRSLKKGYELERRVLDRNPNDLEQRSLVVGNLRLMADQARRQGDITASEGYAQQAWQLGQPILAGGARTPGFRTMMQDALTIAQNHGAASEGPTLGDPNGALPWLDQVHKLATEYAALPASMQNDPEEATLVLRHEWMIRASVLRQLNRKDEARAAYEQALKVSQPIANGSMVARIGTMVLRYTFAEFLMETHDPQRASEVAPPATPPTSQEKGADREQLDQVADLLALHAKIDTQLGKQEVAHREIQQCREIFESLYRADPKDSSLAVQMAASFFDIGEEPKLDPAMRRDLILRGLAVLAPELTRDAENRQYRLMDAEGHLRFVDICKPGGSCPDKTAHIDAAEADLHTVLEAHPDFAEASKMLEQAEALRAGKPVSN